MSSPLPYGAESPCTTEQPSDVLLSSRPARARLAQHASTQPLTLQGCFWQVYAAPESCRRLLAGPDTMASLHWRSSSMLASRSCGKVAYSSVKASSCSAHGTTRHTCAAAAAEQPSSKASGSQVCIVQNLPPTWHQSGHWSTSDQIDQMQDRTLQKEAEYNNSLQGGVSAMHQPKGATRSLAPAARCPARAHC